MLLAMQNGNGNGDAGREEGAGKLPEEDPERRRAALQARIRNLI